MNRDKVAEAAARYVDDPEEIPALVEAVLARRDWRARRGFKVCASCGLEKPPTEFGKDSSRADGLRVVCRECRRVNG